MTEFLTKIHDLGGAISTTTTKKKNVTDKPRGRETERGGESNEKKHRRKQRECLRTYPDKRVRVKLCKLTAVDTFKNVKDHFYLSGPVEERHN